LFKILYATQKIPDGIKIAAFKSFLRNAPLSYRVQVSDTTMLKKDKMSVPKKTIKKVVGID